MCVGCRTRLPVAPRPRCPRCDLPRGTGRREEPDCRECRAWPEALARARHAFLLEPPADALVHALKYGGWAELANEMGRSMARLRFPDGPCRAVVVPVPTTPERVRRRGYNQAALLAGAFAAERGLDVCDALARRRGGATQVALHPSQRRANVQGAFTARPEAFPALAGTRAILVDDVLTTGATAGAAASQLVAAGAAEVILVTYARALPGRRDDGR